MGRNLDKELEHPTLWRELYVELRAALEAGAYGAGARLPSSRAFAREHAVSRSTAMVVYDQLIAEGYLESRTGSGTFATSCAPEPQGDSRPRDTGGIVGGGPGFGPLAQEAIDFRTGLPDLEAFPWDRWERAERLARGRYGSTLISYGQPEGLLDLRRAIAAYLRRGRGLETDPDQLIITGGTTQAFHLIGKVLASLGVRRAFIENPLNRDIPAILESAGISSQGIPVDAEGLECDALPDSLRDSLILVTPSHQFPTGAVLSLRRRRALLARALKDRAWIVEDDYDSEFRYEGPPLTPLASQEADRVVFAGTFSKTFAPGLRVAYARFPLHLVDRARQEKWRIDLHAPCLIQAILSVFLDEGWYDAHLWKMKRRYANKRHVLLQALSLLDDRLTVEGYAAGIHMVARRRQGAVDHPLLDACAREGVKIYPLSLYDAVPGRPGNAVALGFGHLQEGAIQEGVRRIGAATDRAH